MLVPGRWDTAEERGVFGTTSAPPHR
jgi:hypothetical protein